jgi:polyhydroxyalkanoate synthesis regulator phasin
LKIVKWGLGAFGLALVLGVIAVSAGLFSGSTAQAQEPSNGDKSSLRSAYEEKVAQKLGVTVEQLQAAQKSARDEMIDEAVAAGRITQAQADKLKNHQPGDFRGRGGERIKNAIVNVFDTAASILGLSSDDVKAGLKDGKSLNDIAAEKGVSNFEAQMVAKLTADIQAKVADGSITQQQADRLLEHLPDMVHRASDFKGGGKIGEGLRGRFGPGGGLHRQAPPSQTPSQN